jgi:hypothetical protein
MKPIGPKVRILDPEEMAVAGQWLGKHLYFGNGYSHATK